MYALSKPTLHGSNVINYAFRSDKYCKLMLEQLRAAMTPGYSKLLIHDLVLPDIGATEIQARFDLVMMTFNAGMERSEREWTKLLEESGFKITGVWGFPDRDGIVEAELAANVDDGSGGIWLA